MPTTIYCISDCQQNTLPYLCSGRSNRVPVYYIDPTLTHDFTHLCLRTSNGLELRPLSLLVDHRSFNHDRGSQVRHNSQVARYAESCRYGSK